MVEIREATGDDITRINEIEKRSISPCWSADAFHSEIGREDSFFAVAVCDGVVAGFCLLRRVADAGELLRIAVEEAYRRRGIADDLMMKSIEYAQGNALTATYLEVRVSNVAAIGLYRKHGFIEVGKRRGYFDKPQEDAVILCRNLDANFSKQ